VNISETETMNGRASLRTVIAITHVAFEDLGSLGIELIQAGFEIEVMDACTTDLRSVEGLNPDLLVVLGGPVGVPDRDAYPFLELEIELLRARLASRRPTLGICLGAQLMAAAMGANVYPGSHGRELGWAPISAASDSVPGWFQVLLAPQLRVLHWHSDTFDLPAGATHLAKTAQYANQAFTFGNYALALQFHPEVALLGLERWYVGHACELAQAGVLVRQFREESGTFAPELEKAARQFWQQWLEYLFTDA
jgi:GMP synthase (glutamine-hydrolysing)